MKLRELAELPVKDLELRLSEMTHDLSELTFSRATQPLDNPLRLRILRRGIARAQTLLVEYRNGTRKVPGSN